MIGKNKSEEHCKNISLSKKGKKHKPHSLETIEKIKKSNSIIKRDEETRNKITISLQEKSMKKSNITCADIYKMRSLYEHGFTKNMIYLRFPNIKKYTINNIVTNKTYKNKPLTYITPQEAAKVIDKNLKLPKNYSTTSELSIDNIKGEPSEGQK